MKLEKQRHLLSICEKAWAHVRYSLIHVDIPSQEWEDIRSEAFIRVFFKYKKFNPTKGNEYVWVKRVIQRCAWNSLRRVLPDKKILSHKWRNRLINARPLRTIVKTTDDYGGYEIDVIPDIVDQSATGSDLNDFKIVLNQRDRDVLDARMSGDNVERIARRLKLRNATIYVALKKNIQALLFLQVGRENQLPI